MTHAYSELYLNDSQKNLGSMLDYAVHDCNYDIDLFVEFFLKSGYARRFERGNPSVISGMSGVELAREISYTIHNEDIIIEAVQPMDKTAEYWAGWALAAYQWYSGYRFQDIFSKVKMSDILNIYPIFHEMDIQHFYDAMDKKMSAPVIEIKLKKIREAAGLSQSDLAKLSGVSLRSIQMYEQQHNDIDKAQGHTLYKLAVSLGCNIEDLLESPNL